MANHTAPLNSLFPFSFPLRKQKEPYPPLPDTPKTFSISSEFPFFHPTERECLNRLGHLGWIYSQINNFINSVKETRSFVNGTKTAITTPHGAYVLALASSIETTLDEYRQTILNMENRILNKEEEAGANVVPLSLLTANLSKWESLLPSIWKLLLILLESPSEHHGCKLFNLLMDQARTGLSDYRCEIEKMMVQVHNVLYRQLTAWMVYGQLSDPEDEFFIVPYTATSKSKEISVITATASSTAGWNRLYVIDYERIPLHLSHGVVESILFIGKSIATVKEMNKLSMSVTKREEHATSLNSNNNQKINIPDDMTKKHLRLLLTLHNSNKLQQQLHSASSPSPWIKYPQELKKIVSEIRRSTADWLFSRVLVGDHGLHKYLNSFRHLFLLNYGDLATNFIHQCILWRKRSLSRPPVHTIKSNVKGGKNITESPSAVNKNPTRTAMLFRHQELNALFGKSAIGTDAEDQLSGYTLLLDEEKTKEYPFSDLLLLNMRIVLTYDLKWPIDLFLSESDLKKYSNLWSLLIGVKNTQLMLNNLWKLLRSGNTDTLENPKSIVSSAKEASIEEGYEDYQELLVWRLRSSMLFWIDTVWNHIQTNVIDFHYQELIDTTTPSNTKRRSFQPKAKLDFEEIQAAHEYFLTNIINGCLLGSNECIEIVHDILQVCLTFSEKMERISEVGEWRKSKRRKTITQKTAAEIMSQWTKSNTDCTWIEEVKSMEEEFISKTEQFFNIASLQQPDVKSSGRLDVLLMQLDYNK